VPALKNLTVVRLLKQLSSVYKTMRMDRFIAIAPKLTVGAMERLVMAAVRSDQLQLRWDHRSQLLHFTEEGMESQRVKEQLFALAQRLQKVIPYNNHT
jgi:translation initiation factor 3 subunit A